MSAPGFRSRWAEWSPGSPPPPAPEAPPATPPTGLEAPACYRCGSPLADPGGDLLCASCYASRRGPGRVLAFDPRRRLRAIARLSGRPCEDCGAIDWHVTPRGDSACRPCARARGAATTEPGTDGVLGGGVA